MTTDMLHEIFRSGDRVYLFLAATLAVLAALCIAGYNLVGGDGEAGATSTWIGIATYFGVLASVALTAVGLRAGWHWLGGRKGGLGLFTGLAFLLDGALAILAAYTPLNGVGPASGPDGGLFWFFLAIFMAGIGAVVLVGDGIWAMVRRLRRHGPKPIAT